MTGREDKLTQLYGMFPQIPSSYIKRLWNKYEMDARKCIDKLLKIQEYEKESTELNERDDNSLPLDSDSDEKSKRKITNGLIKEPPSKKGKKKKIYSTKIKLNGTY
jgi:hypothetical protein